jgi:hypothetical protein
VVWLPQMVTLGGLTADIKHDYAKGFIKVLSASVTIEDREVPPANAQTTHPCRCWLTRRAPAQAAPPASPAAASRQAPDPASPVGAPAAAEAPTITVSKGHPNVTTRAPAPLDFDAMDELSGAAAEEPPVKVARLC